MMTCHDCGANLDEVPVGTACPNCGLKRRDATVSPPTIAAVGHIFAGNSEAEDETVVVIGQAVELTVSMSVDAALVTLGDPAWRRMEDLAVATTARQVLFHEPGEGGVVVCEVRDLDGTLLDAKPGKDAEDAFLNAADAILPEKPRPES